MNKITAAVLAFGFACLLLSPGWSHAAAAEPTLASADWSVTQAQVLNAESNAAVWNFMNSGASGTDNPENGKLCEFHFVNLRDSGKLSLVICYDGGGTVDCDFVAIIDRTPAGFEFYDFNAAVADLDFDSVQDLNNDGRYELIVSAGLTSGGPTNHCMATWPVVYAWTGNGYSDVSSQYKGYYEKQLASLKEQIAAGSSAAEGAQAPAAGQTPAPQPAVAQVLPARSFSSSSNSNSMQQSQEQYAVPAPSPAAAPASIPDLADVDCTKAEAAKIERFLGISRDAGMSDAIKWAKSDDPNERKFAADVLSEIGTPEAIEYLKTLSHDPDPNVAVVGGGDLLAVNAPEAYPTIKAEPLAKPVPMPKHTKHHHTHAAIGQPVAPLNAPAPN